MISIINYLSEGKEKKDLTKLNDYEKYGGRLAIGGGLIGKAYQMSGPPSTVNDFIGNAGLGTAAVAGAGLAAHKLYKMYKNKKKK